MLEVRFIEAGRQAGRELGVQWNGYSNNGRFLGNIPQAFSHTALVNTALQLDGSGPTRS